MTAAQALEAVRSGDRVWVQSGCGTPSVLVDALVARAPQLRDVEIIHMMTLGNARYTRPEFEGHFRHRGLFLGPNVRDAVAAGRAWFCYARHHGRLHAHHGSPGPHRNCGGQPADAAYAWRDGNTYQPSHGGR